MAQVPPAAGVPGKGKGGEAARRQGVGPAAAKGPRGPGGEDGTGRRSRGGAPRPAVTRRRGEEDAPRFVSRGSGGRARGRPRAGRRHQAGGAETRGLLRACFRGAQSGARGLARPAGPPRRAPGHSRTGFRSPPLLSPPARAQRACPARTPEGRPRAVRARGHPPPPPPPPARGGGEIRSGPAPPSPDLNHLYNTQSFSSVNLPYRSACPPPRVLHVSPPPRRGGCPLGGSAAARARGPRGGRAGPPPRSRGPRSSRSSCPPAPPRGRPPARAALSGASRPNRPRGRRDAGGEDQNVPSPPRGGDVPPRPRLWNLLRAPAGLS